MSDYVTVPTNDVYDVGQLIAQPDITAKLNGKDLTVDYDKKIHRMMNCIKVWNQGYIQ